MTQADTTRHSYKLLAGSNQFGLDVAFPDQIDFDQSKMSLVIPFADGRRRDGVGDLLEVGGIRLERHRANPVVLFDHGKKVELPIAMAAEWDPEKKQYDLSKYTVVLSPAEQMASLTAYFYQGKGLTNVERDEEYDHALFCEQLFDMACKRLVIGGSIGYQVIKAMPLQPNYETGTPQGQHLLSVLMLEGSLVVMPANQDTVRKTLSDGRLCGKALSPVLVKSLAPYAGERKAQMGYERKAKGKGPAGKKCECGASISPYETECMSCRFARGEPGAVEQARAEQQADRETGKQDRKQLKALRAKYRKAMPSHTQGSGHGSTPLSSNITGFEVGDQVTARRYLGAMDANKNPYVFARSGDRLTLVHVAPGEAMKARNAGRTGGDGGQSRYPQDQGSAL